MKRRSFNDRDDAPDEGDAGHQRSLSCSFCNDPTETATLAAFGARCARCYAAYCRAMPSAPGVPAEAVPHGTRPGLAWAYRLRWREQHGERLSKAQSECWRDALKPRLQAEEVPA